MASRNAAPAPARRAISSFDDESEGRLFRRLELPSLGALFGKSSSPLFSLVAAIVEEFKLMRVGERKEK
jgi:hypothetical protein